MKNGQNFRRQIVILSSATALLLISLACGTSSNVAIPTTNPNSIQTAIAGTALVAELQTLTAGVPSTVSVPTNTPEQINTQLPTVIVASTDTSTPEPTESPVLTSGAIIRIKTVNKEEEFVDLENIGSQPQDLSGWRLISEKGDQACSLSGMIMPGETLRVWADNPNGGGYNCNFGSQIWNNSESDPAILRDNQGQEVSRYP